MRAAIAPGVSLFVAFIISVSGLHAQSDPSSYVNPFIGTANSDVPTRWGSEGGTYPGAVAPFGYVQITPETSVSEKKGYYYQDSAIYFFSCLHHFSGYPNGSSGRLLVVPVNLTKQFTLRQSARPFSHGEEKAEPGYYRVRLSDDGTLVEAVAAERSGMIRFTFPRGVTPAIFIGDVGEIIARSGKNFEGKKWNVWLHFSENIVSQKQMAEGSLLTFASAKSHPTEIVLQVSTSSVNVESAKKNATVEINSLHFNQLREKTKSKWRAMLSVVSIDDNDTDRKIIFYTALYHSLLLPWIVSDVDGNYKGYDNAVHKTTGKNEYGGFSPWDTYRTLHPLLCLLFPERQNDMVLSMLDVFQQTGHLPIDPMTGNHAVPVIVDSYLKGVKGYDSLIAYDAMKKSIDIPPFVQSDLDAYHRKGALLSIYPESVTRTVEYSYDDWALSQFSKWVMPDDGAYEKLFRRSYSYRNLFSPQKMLLLPRKENEFKLQPGTFGYKEGDAWVYSYAVPHHPYDLINLMGGDDLFATRLDSALTNQVIIFDNETVLHVPWLFKYAGYPELTQKWVSDIMNSRYSNSPGGLPGNDDLGSMSSWYVFSAMGIFPLSPGIPVYDVGVPVFRSMTIHFNNGKKFHVRNTNALPGNKYLKSWQLNNTQRDQLTISHSEIARGGEMSVVSDNKPVPGLVNTDNNIYREDDRKPDVSIESYYASNVKVKPNELFWIHFSILNKGGFGTVPIKLLVNHQEYSVKNCLVTDNEQHRDSIACRLYQLGKTKLIIEGAGETEVEVIDPKLSIDDQLQIDHFDITPVLKKGDTQIISYTAKNIGWAAHIFSAKIFLDNSVALTSHIELKPGETKTFVQKLNAAKAGLHAVHLNDKHEYFKVNETSTEATIIDISLKNIKGTVAADASGFNNHGKIISTNHVSTNDQLVRLDKDCFVEIPNAISLDHMGESITMMAWVYDTQGSAADLLTKGDHHVLQITHDNKLNFFAGGWGRGECTATLPEDWRNHWHHITGVCDGKTLRLYIDGSLAATTILQTTANLSAESRWNIGRNEEFPGERIFNGNMHSIKIFAAPLSHEEILTIYKSIKP